MFEVTADHHVLGRSRLIQALSARRRAKRIADAIFAAGALGVLLPVLILIALAIRVETPGPALFRQRRIGLGNASFDILKFRTMRWEGAGAEMRQARAGDPRVTRVGAFLRRSSLDELPQLVNILRGEMSLVGPRPHAPGTRASGRPFEQVSPLYAARHRMPPGLTGLAQIRGWRGETDTEDKLIRRLESDLEYIETWSLRRDIGILARTPAAIFSCTNAL